MLRLFSLVAVGLLLSSCSKEDPKKQLSTVDLHGSLVIDQEMTSSRQSQGINGEYYKRILTVNGQEMILADFIKQYCPDANTRNETCVKAYRIKKIDDVSGATKFLPSGL